MCAAAARHRAAVLPCSVLRLLAAHAVLRTFANPDSTGVSAVDLVQRSPPHWQAIGLALACGFVASCYCVLLNL
jgi:hypothetical protein